MKRAVSLALFALLCTAVVACTGQSGASSTAPTAPSPAPPASSPAPSPTILNVTISGAADVGSFQLVALAERSDHTMENATAAAIWTSSNAAIARVAAGGYVTILQDGVVDFSATYQGVTGTLHATVSMPKTYTVSGVVTDAATGAPLANVRVQLLGGSPEATTDAHGKYTLYNVPSGRNLIEFTAAGYDVTEKDAAVADDITLSVSLNATKTQS